MRVERKVKSIGALFGMDEQLEKDGVTVDYGDFRVTMARAGGTNQKFNNVFQKKMKPYRRQIEADQMDEDVASRIMAESYAEAVIKNMDVLLDDGTYFNGILEDDGEVIEFNRENVVKKLIAEPEFFRAVQRDATDLALFRKQALEEDTGNSSTASDGTAHGASNSTSLPESTSEQE